MKGTKGTIDASSDKDHKYIDNKVEVIVKKKMFSSRSSLVFALVCLVIVLVLGGLAKHLDGVKKQEIELEKESLSSNSNSNDQGDLPYNGGI